ncbi:hypothetical protein [Georgenia yuyongxinii]
MARNEAGGSLAGHVAAVAGLVLLLVLLPFYLASGLMAPYWAVGMLIVIWLALFLLGVRWFRRRPFLVLLLPVVAVAVWFVLMVGGESLFGWTP